MCCNDHCGAVDHWTSQLLKVVWWITYTMRHLHVLHQHLTNPGARRLPESWPYQLAWLLYLPSLATQRMKKPNLSRVSTKKPSHLDLFPCESQSPYFPVRMFWRCMSTEHHGIPNCLHGSSMLRLFNKALATSQRAWLGNQDLVARKGLVARYHLELTTSPTRTRAWECSICDMSDASK